MTKLMEVAIGNAAVEESARKRKGKETMLVLSVKYISPYFEHIMNVCMLADA